MTDCVGVKRCRGMSESDRNFVNLNVGGRYFSIDISDIEEYPNSYFSVALKKEWRNGSDSVVINRDGSLFKYIVDFHSFRMLPLPVPAIGLETILAIQSEADFYNLPELIKACNDLIIEQIRAHERILPCTQIHTTPEFMHSLASYVSICWEPSYIKADMFGANDYIWTATLYKQSTVMALNVAELSAAAESTPQGMCVQACKLDRTFLQLFEHSRRFNVSYLPFHDVYLLQPQCDLQVKPVRLVVLKAGESLILDPKEWSCDLSTIGTFVWNLNSAFTGGVLEVLHGSGTTVLSRANQWIAFRRGCSVTTQSVTAGTQVVLVAEVCIRGTKSTSDYFRDKFVQFPSQISAPQATTCDATAIATPTQDTLLNGAFIASNPSSLSDSGLRTYLDQKHIGVNKFEGVLKPLTHSLPDRKNIISSLNEELENVDVVVICLSRLYSLTDVDATALEGGDAVLYELVTKCTEADTVDSDSDWECSSDDGGSDRDGDGGNESRSENVEMNPKDCSARPSSPATSKSTGMSGANKATETSNAPLYDVSFTLVEVDRYMRDEERCEDVDGYLPDLSFGTAKAIKRTTKLIIPLNFTSTVKVASVNNAAIRIHLLTGIEISRRVVDEVVDVDVDVRVSVVQESVL